MDRHKPHVETLNCVINLWSFTQIFLREMINQSSDKPMSCNVFRRRSGFTCPVNDFRRFANTLTDRCDFRSVTIYTTVRQKFRTSIKKKHSGWFRKKSRFRYVDRIKREWTRAHASKKISSFTKHCVIFVNEKSQSTIVSDFGTRVFLKFHSFKYPNSYGETVSKNPFDSRTTDVPDFVGMNPRFTPTDRL